MAGVDWNYYNTVYKLLDFKGSWPRGMAAHIAWQDEGQWRVVGLWRDSETVDQYFATVAIESISRAIQLLGAVPNPQGATDVEPERNEVVNFILGPHARRFVEIGDDSDGLAINVLGGEPIAVQLNVGAMTREIYAELVERIGYAASIPAGLIAHYACEVEDGMRITELWTGSGHALATLGETVLPAIDKLAFAGGVDLPCDHTTHELRRMLFGEEVVAAFGY